MILQAEYCFLTSLEQFTTCILVPVAAVRLCKGMCVDLLQLHAVIVYMYACWQLSTMQPNTLLCPCPCHGATSAGNGNGHSVAISDLYSTAGCWPVLYNLPERVQASRSV